MYIYVIIYTSLCGGGPIHLGFKQMFMCTHVLVFNLTKPTSCSDRLQRWWLCMNDGGGGGGERGVGGEGAQRQGRAQRL